MRAIRSALIVAIAATLVPAVPAAAAPGTTCTFDAVTAVATVTVASSAVATIARSGAAIVVDGSPCQTATASNTDLIAVDVPDGTAVETVVIDLAGGALAPGATDEGDGASEIEIEIELAGAPIGTHDLVRIGGSPGSDEIVVAEPALNLNAAEGTDDHDVTIVGEGALEVLAGEGADTLSAVFTDTFVFADKTLAGQGGDDRLTGPLDGATLLDGGEGRDVADYSSSPLELSLLWGPASEIWSQDADVDDLVAIEVGILSPQMDLVIYEAGGVGKTRLGADVDFAIVMGPTDANEPDERVIRGGPGTFDWITTESAVDLLMTQDTITGTWAARYAGFEYFQDDEFPGGDDRIRIRERGDYPTLAMRAGHDVLDLRAGVEPIDVTLGPEPFGWHRWIDAFGFARVLGSPHGDTLLGPESAPIRFDGLGGHDFLVGGTAADVLVGGRGADVLRGDGGPDVLHGGPGPDGLEGGAGADELSGGPGDDVLFGGPGIDVCSGGGGTDEVHCEG